MACKRGYVPGDRRSFPGLTGAIVGMLLLDGVLVALDALAGTRVSPRLLFLGIDVVWLVGWLLVRRWWLASPY